MKMSETQQQGEISSGFIENLLRKKLRIAGAVAALSVAATAGGYTAKSASSEAKTSPATVVAYPSAETINPTGILPPGPESTIQLNIARNEKAGAWILTVGAKTVAAAIEQGSLPQGVSAEVDFGHFVDFSGKKVPDALEPWDGQARPTEEPNQPLYLQVDVPAGTRADNYHGIVDVNTDGRLTKLPLDIHVFPVTIPPANQVNGNLQTAFSVSEQTYVNTVGLLNALKSSEELSQVGPPLYQFLSENRISPTEYGFGEPKTSSGYDVNARWWLNSADNMVANAGDGSPNFPAMRIPISNQHTTPANYIGGQSPMKPEVWCNYLKSTRDFWQKHGWGSSLPYLYAYDEPGPAQYQLIGRQAAALHDCYPGGKVLVTTNPTEANSALWNGNSKNRVNIWGVPASRFYGEFTVPAQTASGISRERDKFTLIDKARKLGDAIWIYSNPENGTPSFSVNEPLSDSRMLFEWTALENISGVLYTEGMTTYQGDPYNSVANEGENVLLYPPKPGIDSPVPSPRLLQMLYGIQDWSIFNIIRKKDGDPAVWKILGKTKLFSATVNGVQLACNLGCDIKDDSPDAWVGYSHDENTASEIEAARLEALQAASS